MTAHTHAIPESRQDVIFRNFIFCKEVPRGVKKTVVFVLVWCGKILQLRNDWAKESGTNM